MSGHSQLIHHCTVSFAFHLRIPALPGNDLKHCLPKTARDSTNDIAWKVLFCLVLEYQLASGSIEGLHQEDVSLRRAVTSADTTDWSQFRGATTRLKESNAAKKGSNWLCIAGRYR